MKYQVDMSEDAKRELGHYVDDAFEFGEDTASKLVDGLENMISRLEDNPHSGFEKLDFIHDKYKVAHIWKHYWAIFVIYEDDRCVKIDYVIDDRMDYGKLVH